MVTTGLADCVFINMQRTIFSESKCFASSFILGFQLSNFIFPVEEWSCLNILKIKTVFIIELEFLQMHFLFCK